MVKLQVTDEMVEIGAEVCEALLECINRMDGGNVTPEAQECITETLKEAEQIIGDE